MSIVIHKIISDCPDRNYPAGDKFQVEFVLKDDSNNEMRRSILGGLSNDDAIARAEILARADELFQSGARYFETVSNIASPKKDFLDNLPSKQTFIDNIDAVANLGDMKTIVKKLARAVYALKDLGEK